MTTTVTVATADHAAKVFAVQPRSGQAPDVRDFSDLGEVPPHSERDFAVFDGQDILVTEADLAQGEEVEVSGYAETPAEAA